MTSQRAASLWSSFLSHGFQKISRSGWYCSGGGDSFSWALASLETSCRAKQQCSTCQLGWDELGDPISARSPWNWRHTTTRAHVATVAWPECATFLSWPSSSTWLASSNWYLLNHHWFACHAASKAFQNAESLAELCRPLDSFLCASVGLAGWCDSSLHRNCKTWGCYTAWRPLDRQMVGPLPGCWPPRIFWNQVAASLACRCFLRLVSDFTIL